MEALRRSVGQERVSKPGTKRPKKGAAGQKEMPLPIAGKKPAKELGAKKRCKTSAQVGIKRIPRSNDSVRAVSREVGVV